MKPAVSKGLIQFAQAAVAWGVAYALAHFGAVPVHIVIDHVDVTNGVTVAALIGAAEALAARFPALKPWLGSI